MRYKEIAPRDAESLAEKLTASSPPRPPRHVGKGIRALERKLGRELVPRAWDGKGPVPAGWERDWCVREFGDGRALVECTDALADRVPELEGHTDTDPSATAVQTEPRKE